MVNGKVGLSGEVFSKWGIAFQNPASPDTSTPAPPLIGNESPISLCMQICPNDKAAKGLYPFMSTLAGGASEKLGNDANFKVLG